MLQNTCNGINGILFASGTQSKNAFDVPNDKSLLYVIVIVCELVSHCYVVVLT